MIVWSETALERGGINAKELLLTVGTAPTVTRPAPRPESTAEAVKRYVAIYEQSKPTGRSGQPRHRGFRPAS